jgi:plasmid segregation protein ParM
MLAIRDVVSEMLTQKFNVTPSVDQLNEFVDHKHIKLFGTHHYAEDIFNEAAKSTVARIQSEVKRCLGSAADIDSVVFAGGTIEQIRPFIEGWYPHQIVADDPAFANARGMQKYAEYVMSRS